MGEVTKVWIITCIPVIRCYPSPCNAERVWVSKTIHNNMIIFPSHNIMSINSCTQRCPSTVSPSILVLLPTHSVGASFAEGSFC